MPPNEPEGMTIAAYDCHPNLRRLAAIASLAWALSAGCDLETTPATPVDTESASDAFEDATDAVDTWEPVEIGGSCDAPEECVDEGLCIGNPNGVFSCMRTCDTPWARCEDGSICTPVGNGSQVCYTGGAGEPGTSCQSNLQCDDGLLCVGVNDEEFSCLPGCHVREGGCSADQYCKPLSEEPRGYCRSTVGARCADPMWACARELQCSTELPAAAAANFPDGYCTDSCESNGDCPSGVCRTYPGTDVSMCFATCEYDAACRLTDPYTCLEADDCTAQPDAAGCDAFRDGEALCVPPDLQSWPDE